jgi:hypothetical protein
VIGGVNAGAGVAGGSVATVDKEEWFAQTVSEMSLGAHELGAKLVTLTQNVSFGEALRDLGNVQRGLVGGTADRRTTDVTSATVQRFGLSVNNGHMQVVWGVGWCPHIQPPQALIAARMGDQRLVGTSTSPREPVVVSLLGTMNEQKARFGGTVQVKAKELGAIIAELTAAGNAEVTVAPLGGAAPNVTTVRVLPVHRKVALLFLRGMTLLAAAQLVQAIMAQMEPAEEAELTALVNFVRVACTTVEAQSGVEANWHAVNLPMADELFEWCEGQKARYLDQVAGAPMAQQGQLVQPGREGGGGGGLELGAQLEMLNAVADAMDRLATVSTAEKASKWTTGELERFAFLANPTAPRPLDASVLTPFFRALEECRNKQLKARMLLEQTLAGVGGPGGIGYTTVYSTETIKALCHMDMIGGDVNVTWACRGKGISIFGFAPCPVGLSGAAQERRALCVQHEEAVQKKQTEIAAAAAATTMVEDWPDSPERFIAYIGGFHSAMSVLFGPMFLVQSLLARLLQHSQMVAVWQTMSPLDIAALTWGVHRGIRMALGPVGDLSWLTAVVEEFRTGNVPDWRRFPDGVQDNLPGKAAPKPAYQRPNDSGGGGGGDGGGRTSGKRQAQTQMERDRSTSEAHPPEYARAWTEFVEAARARIGTLNGMNFAETQATRDALFGSEFIALMPANKSFPCASYFLLGRCHTGCRRSHATTSAPSQQVIDGIRDRMKVHCLTLKPKNS